MMAPSHVLVVSQIGIPTTCNAKLKINEEGRPHLFADRQLDMTRIRVGVVRIICWNWKVTIVYHH